MEDEHKRQNHRLAEFEEALKQQNRLLLSVERLAVNMENMQKEQKEQGARLEILESRDGAKWRNAEWLVITGIIMAVVGYVAGQLNL